MIEFSIRSQVWTLNWKKETIMQPSSTATLKATLCAVLLPLAFSAPAIAQSTAQGAAGAQQSSSAPPSYLIGGGGKENTGASASSVGTGPHAEQAATGIRGPWYRPGDYGYTPETHERR